MHPSLLCQPRCVCRLQPSSFFLAAELGPPAYCQLQGFGRAGAASPATRRPAEIRRIPVTRRLCATAKPPCSCCPSACKSTRLESSRIHLGFMQQSFSLLSLCLFFFFQGRKAKQSLSPQEAAGSKFQFANQMQSSMYAPQQTEFKSPDSSSNFVAADRGFYKSFV